MLSRRHLRMLALGALLSIPALGATVVSAADEPENIVKYRKATMGANAAHMGMIAAALKGEVSWTDEIAVHAHAVNEMSKNLARLFPPGTGKDDGLDSRALVVIWEEPDDFAAQIATFQETTAALAEAADGGDMAAIGQALGAVGKDGCGACHETYREKR
jgi:cytochrome c556